MIFERKKYLEELVGARINLIKNYFLQARFLLFDDLISRSWRKRSIPTHSGWLYPLTFDAEKGLKEA